MADGSVAITAGTGTPIRVLTGMGAGNADQQVISLADSAGNLLGTNAAPLPVFLAGGGGLATVSGTLSAAGTNTPGTAATTSNTGAVVASVGTAGNITFAVISSAFVGTISFEASVDAGLNYGAVMAIREDGSGAESSAAISTASAFIRIYTVALPGLQYFRVRTSAFTSGTLAVYMAPGPTLVEPNPSLSAGSQVIGAVSIGAATQSSTFYTSTTTNAATVAKASAGSLQTLVISNTAASTQYVKIFNAAAVTLATTAAVIDMPVPTLNTIALDLGANGLRMTNGIAFAITGASGATNNTAGAGGVYVALTYV